MKSPRRFHGSLPTNYFLGPHGHPACFVCRHTWQSKHATTCLFVYLLPVYELYYLKKNFVAQKSNVYRQHSAAIS
jgi:hypothetical protein